MEVMAEKPAVLAMIAGRWPDARHDRSAAYVTVTPGSASRRRLPCRARASTRSVEAHQVSGDEVRDG